MTKTLTIVSRWIAFFPVVLLMYFVFNLINRLTAAQFLGGLLYDLNQSSGFGGHYLMGPLWCYYENFTGAGVSSALGIACVAPNKKAAAVVLIIGFFVISSVSTTQCLS